MSTGFKGAENANINIGDTVAIFAQGPIGLCATAGARLRGASLIIAISSSPEKLMMAGKMGANVLLNYKETDVIDEIFKITAGRGVDASIECLGTQATFNQALRVLKPGGTLSSLGVYSDDIQLPVEAFAYGLGDHTIRSALCPGGKERMRRMMNVIQHGGLDLTPFVTHRFQLENIAEAYHLFSEKRDGVIKLAITP